MTQLYRMHKTKRVTFQRQVNELKQRTQKEVQAMIIAWTSFSCLQAFTFVLFSHDYTNLVYRLYLQHHSTQDASGSKESRLIPV